MDTSQRQRENYLNTVDNTHGGNNKISVSNSTKNGKHSNNAHDSLDETPVNNVTTGLDEEADDNTSFISNIYQGDGADSISQGSQDEMDDMEDADDTSSINDYSQLNISEDDFEHSGDSDDHEDDNVTEDDDRTDAQVPPAWYEPHTNKYETRPRVLEHIVANDRVAMSADLPTIAATNMRSIFPKLRNFAEDMLMRGITVSLISESWDKQKRSKKVQYEVERIFERSGLKFISCPRPSNKRGGGSAIVVNTKDFSCEKLNVLVPGKLEFVWAILRPRAVKKEMQFKEIILCAFYSPPKSRKNAKLLDHMISTLNTLLTKYPNCGWVAGGDKNQFPLGPLLGALPKCRQLVTKNTYKNRKIYDILLTNMGQFYNIPYIAKAVAPDSPSSGAVPSDHDCAVAVPLAGAGCNRTMEYTVRTSQPFPQSGINEFGAWLHQVRWEGELHCELSSTEMASKMEDMLRQKVCVIFPTKTVRVSTEDKPFITAELKKLDKYIKREYKARGKSDK